MTKSLTITVASLALSLLLVAASQERPVRDSRDVTSQPAPAATVYQPSAPVLRVPDAEVPTAPALSDAAPLYYLNWWSVNGGGATSVNGTNFRMGLSAGQAAAGFVTGTNFRMGVGFWYGAASAACPIAVSGDLNLSTSITSADIILLVNYVFKAGAAPLPCPANGDVNCSGSVTSADIIVLVNYVFKAGAAPCNICTIIPSLWSCP